jgi:hypothetical protein
VILDLLILENIDIPYHNYKYSYPFYKICRNHGMLRSSTHLNRSVHIISRISHIIKPSYLLSGGWKITRNPTKLPYINKASFAPSAGKLRILLLLLLLQMVHSLDVHTCSLLDTVLTCLLVILCWRPHFILIPVAVIVVLLLFWWAAHRAYRALSDTLVKVVIHLIILVGS